MSIRFNDCFFSEPTDLNAWTPPQCGGLFGILVADPNWAPQAFQPLYFGEFGNNARAAALLRECNQVLVAAGSKRLLVSVFPMPYSTTQQRWTLRNELVRAYNPVFQTEAGAIHGPEKPLVANMNPGLEAPVVRRRQFGFVQFAEPAGD